MAKVPLTISLDADVKARLERAAAQQEITVSDLVRRVVETWLDPVLLVQSVAASAHRIEEQKRLIDDKIQVIADMIADCLPEVP